MASFNGKAISNSNQDLWQRIFLWLYFVLRPSHRFIYLNDDFSIISKLQETNKVLLMPHKIFVRYW